MTIPTTTSLLRQLYVDAGVVERFIAVNRPKICPFDVLVDWTPQDASVLDIGCGSGVFLNLLAARGRISSGTGIDASLKAVEIARGANGRLGTNVLIQFLHRPVEGGLPEGTFEMVALCDLIHHIDPVAQRATIELAASRVAPGGALMVKEIADRPLWRASANRLHDLVKARQWVHYVPADEMTSWMHGIGFEVTRRTTIDMLWYRHELLLYRRRTGTPNGNAALSSG